MSQIMSVHTDNPVMSPFHSEESPDLALSAPLLTSATPDIAILKHTRPAPTSEQEVLSALNALIPS